MCSFNDEVPKHIQPDDVGYPDILCRGKCRIEMLAVTDSRSRTMACSEIDPRSVALYIPAGKFDASRYAFLEHGVI